MRSAFVLLLFIILSTLRKKIDSSLPLSFFKDLFSRPLFERFKKIFPHSKIVLLLITVFTEVRLKKYIEIRSLDTCELDCHCGGPAFYVGLLYGNLDLAYEIISKWKVPDILNAYIDAPKKGLNTIINNKTILEWGKIFLDLSKKGLEKRSLKNDSGKDESIFLRSVESIINNNKTKADITIEKFKNKKDLGFLYEKT